MEYILISAIGLAISFILFVFNDQKAKYTFYEHEYKEADNNRNIALFIFMIFLLLFILTLVFFGDLK